MKEGNSIWLLRCCIALVLFLGYYYWVLRGPATGERVASFVLLSLPWLVALCLPASKIDIAAGLVAGGAFAMTPMILLLTMLGLEISMSSVEGVGLLLVMGLAAVVGIRLSLRAFKGRQGTALILAACTVVYEGGVIQTGIPWLASFEFETKARPLEAMFNIQICLDRYKQSHGTYPDTLKPMTNQEHCLDDALLNRIDKISYSPRKDPAPGYDLNVEHRALWKNQWQRFSSSQLGVIQESHNIGRSREVTSAASFPNAAQLIYTLSRCLERFHRSHGAIPANLSEMWKMDPYACPETTVVATSDTYQDWAYSYTYVATPSDSTFELSARPNRYGGTGVRSYYRDAEGKIHVTMQDRAATLADDLSPPCEYEENVRC